MSRLVRQSFTAMTPVERSRILAMYGVIAGLHVAGFFILFAFVLPSHYQGLGIGVAVLAYTLGLRHAFDADHISAIDNNFAITGLSVAICLFIGGIETLSLIPYQIKSLSQSRGFWGFLSRFNLNTAGFVIVAMFLLTWLAAQLIWRYGRIEEKWSARLQPGTPDGTAREPAWTTGSITRPGPG